jgi:FdhD protein
MQECESIMAGDKPFLVDVECERYERGNWRDFVDCVSREVSVTLHWPGREAKVLWSAPKETEILALGHACIEFCRPGEIPVVEKKEPGIFWLRPETGRGEQAPAPEPSPITPSHVLKKMEEFIEAEGSWNQTGCFHRAGLYDPAQSRFLSVAEDIGRHNCLDRLAGKCLQKDWTPGALFLFVSARLTASLMTKALKAGFTTLVSRSAVTTAAIEMAEEQQATLVGFSRPNRFTVFSDPHGRIVR